LNGVIFLAPSKWMKVIGRWLAISDAETPLGRHIVNRHAMDAFVRFFCCSKRIRILCQPLRIRGAVKKQL
jgi:hypothetical protein